MQDRFRYRAWDKTLGEMLELKTDEDIVQINANGDLICFENNSIMTGGRNIELMQCTGLRDLTGKPIFEGDIIVIPHQYPFYDYKNKEDMKQDLNETQGEIRGESVLNYIGIVEWIYSQWQYVYHCVNPNKKGISEGINNGLNDYGFEEGKNTYYKIIGNIYENPELLEREW